MARLNPVYSTPQPNEPIWLHEGPIKLGGNDELATFRFCWLPRQEVRFGVANLQSYPESFDTTLSLPGVERPVRALVSDFHVGNAEAETLVGMVNGKLDMGLTDGLSWVTFHVAVHGASSAHEADRRAQGWRSNGTG